MRGAVMRLLARMLACRDLLDEVSNPSSSAVPRSVQRTKLVTLLTRANEAVPFFRGRFTAFLEETRTSSDEAFFEAYGRLPTYGKRDYVGAGDGLFAGKGPPAARELRFDGGVLRGLLGLRRGSVFLDMATGGSSKLPLTVRMDRNHLLRLFFSFFRCWRSMGWRLGDAILVFDPRGTYNIDDLTVFNRLGWLFGFRLHLFDRIDEATTSDLLDYLATMRPRLLMTFPSPLTMVAHLVERHGMTVPFVPPLVNVSGETFFGCQRATLARVFPSAVVRDSYGSVEFGEIAHETDRGFEIFSDLALVETVPAADGRDELVVTMLDLLSFPFIRYRIGDVATVAWNAAVQFLTPMEGKAENCLRGDPGARLYPSDFNGLVDDLNESFGSPIVEAKMRRQLDGSVTVRYITRGDEPVPALERATLERLQVLVGSDLRGRVEFVRSMDHDYRRKYRVIEPDGAVEYVGGVLRSPP